MKKKNLIPNLLMLVSAILAEIRLSGLPSELHLTPARLILMVFVLMTCMTWFTLVTRGSRLWRRKGLRAVLFQAGIFSAAACGILISAGKRLMTREGMLYSIGAFITQAQPFLFFLIVFFLCTALLAFLEASGSGQYPLRLLFTENRTVMETILLFLACLLVFGAFFPLRDNYYPSHDSAIFSYIGQQILRGKMPYTELWDHKPPVIFYLNALGLKAAHGSLLGIWVLEFAAFFIEALILLKLLKKRFQNWLILPVLLPGLLHFVRVLDFGNYTEEVSLFFAVCMLGIYFSDRSSGHTAFRGLISGILCGFAFTSKQNTIGCWAALFILDVFYLVKGEEDPGRRKQRITFWIMTALGFLLVNAGWVIYFAANHALEAYWDVAFRFNFIYSERSGDSRLACAWTTLTFLPSVSLYLLLGFLSVIPVCFFIRKNKAGTFTRENSLTLWALIDLPIELIFAGLSGMNYQHYFILCIPPVIILLCSALNSLTYPLYRKKWIIQTVIIITLFAGSFPLLKCFKDNYLPRTPSSYTKVRDYLLEETDPAEPILVWGSRTAIYVMSNRHAPTAYFNERPLYLFPGAIQAEQWAEFLSDIQNEPPQVVVYTHDTALPFVNESSGSCAIPAGADYTIPVYQFFCDQYRYETTINPEFYDAWDVYRRK